MSRIPPAVIGEVYARAGGYCEAGGAQLDGVIELHHRKARGSGGKGPLDTAPNLILVHRRCHERIHANPARSYGLGQLLRLHQDPGSQPSQLLPGLCWLK